MDGSMSNKTSTGLAPMLADRMTDRLLMSRSIWNGCRSSAILPASTLEKSRIWLMSPSSDLLAPSALLA